MNILYIGAGFVGACSAAVSADSGHNTLVYDVDENRVDLLGSGDRKKIESCIFESGLAEMLNRSADKIKFTADYGDADKFIDSADVVFMCLPTPEKDGANGESDLSYYFSAAESLAKSLKNRNSGKQLNYIVIVNKSTVPINMVNETEKMMKAAGVQNFGVVSNPEFLIEGKAIEGSVHPERVIVGAWADKDFEIMRQVYQRFYNSINIKYIEVNPKEAAAAKLAANYCLFNRLGVTFDVVGRICEVFDGINYEKIRSALISDSRIGSWGFYDSLYAGGSCFIKDAASLAHQMEEAGANAAHIRQTMDSNNFQRDHFYSRAVKEAGFSWEGKKVAVLGAAFKQETNDIRNSPTIDIVRHMVDDGVSEIRVYDPVATHYFMKLFDQKKDDRYSIVKPVDSEEDALQNTQVCLVLTDWPKFRALGDIIAKICPPPYLVMDGRRMLAGQLDKMAGLGYDVIAVGSPYIRGKENI